MPPPIPPTPPPPPPPHVAKSGEQDNVTKASAKSVPRIIEVFIGIEAILAKLNSPFCNVFVIVCAR
jgi:hypothetical protein